MTDKELIKQEIERQIDYAEDDTRYTEPYREGLIAAYQTIKAFIDNSLPEEPASKDLDFLAIKLEETIGTSPHSREVIKEHLQKAAEWGRNHFEDKSEMVSEETTIVNDWQYGKDQDHAIIPAIHQRIEGFNVGDKVKIIIVKTEQQ